MVIKKRNYLITRSQIDEVRKLMYAALERMDDVFDFEIEPLKQSDQEESTSYDRLKMEELEKMF